MYEMMKSAQAGDRVVVEAAIPIENVYVSGWNFVDQLITKN